MATTNIQSFSGKIEVNGTTPSSSKTTGALTVAGGVGVTSNIHASNLFASDYVAIGTTSPGQKLEVGHYGGALSSDLGAIRITNHATNLHATSLARFDISLGDIGSNTGSGKRKLIFNSKTTTTDSGTDILCLDGQTNNVGIGTDSPATKCQIAGKTTISENISTQNETRVYNADLSVVSEIPYLNSGTADIDIGAASTEIGDYTSTYRYKLYTDVGSGNSSFKIASVSSLSDRYSGYGTVTDRITLLPSGNVGIGTASPLAQLDVMTAAGGTGLYVRGDEYGTNNQATHIRIGAGGGAANAHHAMITGGHTTSGSSYLSFSTIEDVNTDGYDPAERMRIDRFGNVGIGVTNPTRSLQIERGISYISGGTSNNSAFEIVQQLGTDDYTFKGQHRAQFRIKSGLGTYSNRSLELALLDNGRGIMQASAASEGYFPISINPKGDYNSTVSIGSYYSSAKLRVEGNVYATSTIQSAGQVWGTAFLNPTSTTYLGQSYSNPTEISGGGHIRFVSDGAEKMRITSGGNVGIGTVSPRQKLEVANGHIAIVQNAWKSEGVDDQLAGKIDFHLGNDSGQLATPVAAIEAYDKFQTGSSYRGDLAFKTMGNERMRLDSDGRMVLNGKCRAGNGFTTYEFSQSLAKQTWTDLFDLRSTLFAYGQTYISGTDYGISTGGHGVFYVYTDTGGYNYSYTSLHNNGVSFRVSSNNLQAYWSSYLGGPRTIYFRYTVLNNRR
jgi:hypothetical protein